MPDENSATVKEVRVKFTADAAAYRQQLRNVSQPTKEIKDRVDEVGEAVKRANHLTQQQMAQFSRALSSAGSAAVRLGKQSVDLYSQSTKLSRAISAEQNSLAKLRDEYQSTEARMSQLQNVYDTIKDATKGLDLSTPLAEQRERASAEMDQLSQQVEMMQARIAAAQANGSSLVKLDDGTVTLSIARQRLDSMSEALENVANRYQQLGSAMRAIGRENLGYATSAGLRQLQTEIGNGQRNLETLGTKITQADSRLTDYAEALGVVRTRQEETADKTRELGDAVQELSAEADPGIGARIGALFAGMGQRIGQAFSTVSSAVRSRLVSGLQMAGTGIARVAGRLLSLSPGMSILRGIANRLRGVRESSQGADIGLARMVRSIRNINIAGMAMRGVTLLFGRLRSVVQQYLSENRAAQSAVNGLKSAFANALAPAINIAINALSAILPVIQAISNAFATLVTNLFGAKWTTISGGASGAASAIGGAGKAAKDAAAAQKALNRELYSFDQITKQEDKDSSSSGGGGSGSSGGGGTQTSTIGGGEGVMGLFSQFSELFDPLKQAWEAKGAGVMDAARGAFEQLKAAATSVGTSLKAVWTEGTGKTYVESLLGKWQAFLNVIGALAGTFAQAWNEAGRGDSVIRSIFERATSVNTLIGTIAQSFANAWNSGTGTAIWGSLLDIVKDVNTAIANLAAGINKAWSESGRGEGIWKAILAPVKTILDHIHNITTATAQWAGKLDFAPLLDGVKRVLEAIDPIVDGIGKALEGVWTGVVLPLGQWIIESGLPTFLNGVAEVLERIGSIAQKVGDTFKALGDWASKIKFNGIDGLLNGEGLFTLPSTVDLTANLKTIWAPGAEEKIDKTKSLNGATMNATINDNLKEEPAAMKTRITTGLSGMNAPIAPYMTQSKSTLWSNWVSGWKAGVGIDPHMTQNKGAFWNNWHSGWSASVGIGPYMTQNKSTLWKNWHSGWKASVGIGPYMTQNKGTFWNKWRKGWKASVAVAIKAQNRLGMSDIIKPGSITLKNGNSKIGSVKAVPMARGGIVNSATLFPDGTLRGEAGREAVVPLEHHTEWLDKVADRLNALTQSSDGNGGNTIIEVNVGGEHLVRQVVKGVNDETRRTGHCPIYV